MFIGIVSKQIFIYKAIPLSFEMLNIERGFEFSVIYDPN